MTLAALVAAMCLIADGYRPTCKRAAVLAPFILQERRDIDPLLLAAVAFRESSFDQRKIGRHGEVGAWQVKPDGWASTLCRADDVSELRQNVRCAVRILLYGRRRCGGTAANWLGWYQNGNRCGPSGYAEKVMATWKTR